MARVQKEKASRANTGERKYSGSQRARITTKMSTSQTRGSYPGKSGVKRVDGWAQSQVRKRGMLGVERRSLGLERGRNEPVHACPTPNSSSQHHLSSISHLPSPISRLPSPVSSVPSAVFHCFMQYPTFLLAIPVCKH